MHSMCWYSNVRVWFLWKHKVKRKKEHKPMLHLVLYGFVYFFFPLFFFFLLIYSCCVFVGMTLACAFDTYFTAYEVGPMIVINLLTFVVKLFRRMFWAIEEGKVFLDLNLVSLFQVSFQSEMSMMAGLCWETGLIARASNLF